MSLEDVSDVASATIKRGDIFKTVLGLLHIVRLDWLSRRAAGTGIAQKVKISKAKRTYPTKQVWDMLKNSSQHSSIWDLITAKEKG